MRTKKIEKHLLSLSTAGSEKYINSIHYGCAGADKKVYIQAGLHADEAPGYMVMHYFLELLDIADSQDKIRGGIICVPAANPIGFNQWFYDRLQGRFDTSNGINFNRNFPDIVKDTADIIQNQLTDEPNKNKNIIRDAMKIAIDNIHPENEAEALKKMLFSLSFDADIVLDLHCDNQAVLHLYTGESLWSNSNQILNSSKDSSDAHELAAWIGAEAVLLADDSGGEPYDEACSKIWWRLKELYPDHPIYPSCLAATIEYRGEADVSENLNMQDAINIYSFLHQQGYLSGSIPSLKTPLFNTLSIPELDNQINQLQTPKLKAYPTPLSGVEHIKAPVSGVVHFLKRPGGVLKAGDKVAEIINPYGNANIISNYGGTGIAKNSIDEKTDIIENRVTEIFCKIDGLLFSITSDRMARQGRILAKIAGKKPIEGKGKNLLTA